MIRRPPRSTQSRSSAASDVYKRQATLPGHSGEPGHHFRRRTWLEQRRLRVDADVARDFEPAVRPAALGVRLPLGDTFPVELRHLLDQVTVLQQDRSARADGQRVLVTLDRDTRIVGSRIQLLISHCYLSSRWIGLFVLRNAMRPERRPRGLPRTGV